MTNFENAINKMMVTCGYNARYEHILYMEKVGIDWYNRYTCNKFEKSTFKQWWMDNYKVKSLLISRDSLFDYWWAKWGLKEVSRESVIN